MGRFSISIGRRLGEIYDKVIRFATSKRFNLKLEEVSPIFEDLQLDIRISFESLSNEDKQHLVSIFHTNFPNSKLRNGLGIEIRYNFNPNDSSRLKKDVKMGSLLQDAGLFPIYLIFSVISPRKDAIARLKRAGWNFLVGKAADDFMYNLVDMDFAKILDGPKIQSEIRQEIDMLMKEMRNSIAFKRGAKIE